MIDVFGGTLNEQTYRRDWTRGICTKFAFLSESGKSPGHLQSDCGIGQLQSQLRGSCNCMLRFHLRQPNFEISFFYEMSSVVSNRNIFGIPGRSTTIVSNQFSLFATSIRTRHLICTRTQDFQKFWQIFINHYCLSRFYEKWPIS